MSKSIPKVKNPVKAKKVKKILKNRVKKTRFKLLVVGIILIIAGSYLSTLSFTAAKTENSSSPTVTIPKESNVSSFSEEPVKVDKELLTEKKKINPRTKKEEEKFPPLRILVPSVNIDVPVAEAKVVKGYWEVFKDKAGFGSGSAYPDETGNTVIFAHARKGLFLPLKDISAGDNIYIFTSQGYFMYKTENINEVSPSEVGVIGPTENSVLTLYTCSGYADNKRLIVRAKKIPV